MYGLSQAVRGIEKTASGATLSINFVYLFRKSTIQSYMALLHGVANENEVNLSDSKVWLLFSYLRNIVSG